MADKWVCTLRDINKFKQNSFKKRSLQNEGRPIDMVMANDKNGTALIQRMEYPKGDWDVFEAQKHCIQQGGTFTKLKIINKNKPQPKVVLKTTTTTKKPEASKQEAGGKVTTSPMIDHNRTKNYVPTEHTDLSVLDTRFLKLDCSNDPLTNTLDGDVFDFTGDSSVKDLTLTDFSGGTETVTEILEDILNPGILDEITVTDAGGLNISWTAGEIYNITTKAVVDTDAGAGACTDNLPNYLIWTAGTTLTLRTTSADPSTNEIEIAHIFCQDGDIWGLHQDNIMNRREYELTEAIASMFPSIVTTGLIVSEDTDITNVWDVVLSSGVYYHEGSERHTVAAPVYSRITNMVRWFHVADAWTSDVNAEIDVTQWDDPDGGGAGIQALSAVAANRYYRSNFFIVGSTIHWIYPDTEYLTIAAAQSGGCPLKPPGFVYEPSSTCVIIKGNDAAFPTAGGEQWIDVRPIIGSSGSTATSDHGNLSGLADDDHLQYALLAGRAGSQTLIGGTASGEDLTLQSTVHATKGSIIFGTSIYDEVNNFLGIGTATPGNKLDILTGATTSSAVHIGEVVDEGIYLSSTRDDQFVISGGTEIVAGSWIARSTKASVINGFNGKLVFYTDDSLTDGNAYTPTDRMNISADGIVNIGGGANSEAIFGQNLELQTSANYGGLSLNSFSATAGHCPLINFQKSSSDTIGANSLVVDDEDLGRISFRGNDGTNFEIAGRIRCEVDGTAANNDMPGRITIETTPSGTTSPVERIRIDNAGNIGIGATNPKATLQIDSISNVPIISSLDAITIGYNTYFSGGFKRIATDNHASIMTLGTAGTIDWYTQSDALSAADSAITFVKRLVLSNAGYFGVGNITPSAQVHIDQASTTAAIPVLKLDQADESEGFIDFIGTTAASALGPLSSWTAGNNIQGFARVEINGVARWIPYYDDPTG